MYTEVSVKRAQLHISVDIKIVKIASTGQHNDARMNLAIGLTAVRHGASAANHVEVLSLLKQKGMFCEFSNISNHCWIFFFGMVPCCLLQ